MRKSIVITLIVGLLAAFSVLGMAATTANTTVNATVNNVVAVTISSDTCSVSANWDEAGSLVSNNVGYTNTYNDGKNIDVSVTSATGPPPANLTLKASKDGGSNWTDLTDGSSYTSTLTLSAPAGQSSIGDGASKLDLNFQLDASGVGASEGIIGSADAVSYTVTLTISS